MFAHLVDIHGAIELDQVHRFRHQWERRASLRLRNGEPAVLTEYNRQGRLHGGTHQQMESEILDAWTAARRRSVKVALMASSTATVTRLNHLAQQRLIETGQLDPTGPCLRNGSETIMVDDEVVTRRNDRTLSTDRSLMVKNRDHWTVTQIHPDSSLTLTGITGTVRLPAGYVSEHVELGYAQTSHATQGRTVDTSLLLVDTPTDSRGIYTPMTRGRDANHAYVVTEESHTAVDMLARSITRDWIDQPAIARRVEFEVHGQDPPRWQSLKQYQHNTSDPSRGVEPDQEPAHADRDRDDEHTAEEQRVRRLIEKRLAAIQQRRHTVSREHPTIGR
jgi:hypothetical protein